MAFHSFPFILGALPILLAGFLLAHRIAGWPGAFNFLAVASLAYYAQFGTELLIVLLVSVVGNYSAGEVIRRLGERRQLAAVVLIAAIAANLIGLGYFKYTNFLVDIANGAFGTGFSHAHLLVPIGVSFFTFIQIGYLIEVFGGQATAPGFGRYVLFATFFPCVTAGPLVLQREMFEQMGDRRDHAFDTQRIAVGLTLFAIGLFKKVVLADSIAPFANVLFDGVGQGAQITSAVAWVGALCYALQLYFDFSGYSDMAIGLGCIFGLRLPLNFNSPFKATNISEFWRRWHMTMTRFFTTFIYTPLAMRGMRWALGSNASRASRYLVAAAMPAVVTFLVAGVWHGAGWTFVVYGLIHGIAIATCLAWRDFGRFRIPSVIGWMMTMAVVVSALVVFRAHSLPDATAILSLMWAGGAFAHHSIGATALDFDMRMALAMVVLLGSITLLMPNSQQMLHRFQVSSDSIDDTAPHEAGLLVWQPTFSSALATAIVSCVAIASIGATSTFLYYQF